MAHCRNCQIEKSSLKDWEKIKATAGNDEVRYMQVSMTWKP
jgi:hypothetical protein